MTEETYNELLEEYKSDMMDIMQSKGELYPHIVLYCKQKKDDKKKDESLMFDEINFPTDKPSVVFLEIPSQFANNNDGKDFFVDVLLPEMYKKFIQVFDIEGVGWVSEVTVRVINKDDLKKDMSNYQDFPVKKEALIMNIDTDLKSETILFDVKVLGHNISSGEKLFIRRVELKEIEHIDTSDDNDNPPLLDGRFVNLFKKLKKHV